MHVECRASFEACRVAAHSPSVRSTGFIPARRADRNRFVAFGGCLKRRRRATGTRPSIAGISYYSGRAARRRLSASPNTELYAISSSLGQREVAYFFHVARVGLEAIRHTNCYMRRERFHVMQRFPAANFAWCRHRPLRRHQNVSIGPLGHGSGALGIRFCFGFPQHIAQTVALR
jgi:hypothetical protein